MFEGWDSYFILIGTAAAGLIGLLFVVVTLTAGFERTSAMRGQTLYMTPTMVHFAIVFSLSAVAVAPRLSVVGVTALATLGTLAGLLNSVRASWGIARPRPDTPAPHWSDLWCYGCAPALIYLCLLGVCGLIFAQSTPWAARALAVLLLTLLLLAIRNAWDLITWIAPMGAQGAPTADAASAPPGDPPSPPVTPAAGPR